MENGKNIEKNVQIHINDNCYMRTLVPSDVSDRYVDWLNDYELMKYTYNIYSKHTVENVLEFVNKKCESKNDCLFGIFFDDLHIGNFRLGPIKWMHERAEISFFIGDRKYWSKGIATQCIRGVVEYANKELAIKKFTAGYYKGNISSAKALEKSGFVIEGKRLSNNIFEGRRVDKIEVGYAP